METAQLVPVSQWVYDLYKVTYWTSEKPGARELGHKFFAATDERHLSSDANDAAPSKAGFMTWEVVKENVGHPRVIGNLHGLPLHETSLSHGQRIAGML